MTYLPDDLYRQIEASMPIACVDFVPVRIAPDGTKVFGLILRESPYGRVWCHLGGRIQRGETIADVRTSSRSWGSFPRLSERSRPERERPLPS